MNQWRLKASCAAVALALGFAAPSATVHAQGAGSFSQNVVKIGVLTDMSGIFGDLAGPGSVVAAQMAIDDFKAQAKPSFKIELISADHLNKADVGASKAREWYDVQNVDMITDVINSGVALAVAKVAHDKNRVAMITGSGTTRLHNEDCNPNTIHYGWDTRTSANGQVIAQKAEGKTSWYFVSVDYALGRSLEQDATEAIKANGGTVVGSVKHPIGAADFSSFMLQAQASKAQVIAIANAGSDLINAVKAANEYRITQKQTLAGLVATIIDVHAMGLEATQGMVTVEDFYWNQNNRTREWSQRFYASQKRMPNYVHAGTYSSVITYLKAVQAANTDAPAEVLAKMKGMTINDIFATNGKIRSDHKMVHDVYVLEVKKPSESKGPWDYYHVRRTMAGEETAQPLSASKCQMVKKPA